MPTPHTANARPQQHRFTYNEPMSVESTTQSLCDLALRFGEDDEEGGMVSGLGGAGAWQAPRGEEGRQRKLCALTRGALSDLCPQSRPFGVALLIAGWDENGPVL